MLEPSRFKDNEAWVAFQLNDEPIRTEHDGHFNCIALMDAASGFIFGTGLVSVAEQELSTFEARRLLKASLERSGCTPATIFIPERQLQAALPAEARRHGIAVVFLHETELLTFTEEAKQGFREHVQGGRT